MEYRSPLDNAYGPEKPSELWSKERRYAPYGVQSSKIENKKDESSKNQNKSSSSNSNTSSHGSPPKYSERYKPSKYPKELTSLFEAARCKLCLVDLMSPIVAKMHYSGKPHIKKIKSFLLSWSLQTGNPMPEINEPNSEYTGSALADYCELCCVRLNSKSDKLLHYSGKTHRSNMRDPNNAKKKTKVYKTANDTTGRFGIGASFSAEGDQDAPKSVGEDDFVCKLCDVKTISQDQLNHHLSGKKHKDKVAKKESAVPIPVNPNMSILSSVMKDKLRDSVDYSMHRTPSGQYYCSVCNLSLNAELQFIEHIENKKHKKKLMGTI